jgi:hypothetical protein
MGVQEMLTESLTQPAAGGHTLTPAGPAGARLPAPGSTHDPAATTDAGDVTLTTPSLQRRYDDLSLEHQGLVLVRALLELRGVSQADLIAHDARTARVRAELDRLVDGRATEQGDA